MADSDHELMNRCRRGDSEAFETLLALSHLNLTIRGCLLAPVTLAAEQVDFVRVRFDLGFESAEVGIHFLRLAAGHEHLLG